MLKEITLLVWALISVLICYNAVTDKIKNKLLLKIIYIIWFISMIALNYYLNTNTPPLIKYGIN